MPAWVGRVTPPRRPVGEFGLWPVSALPGLVVAYLTGWGAEDIVVVHRRRSTPDLRTDTDGFRTRRDCVIIKRGLATLRPGCEVG